MQNFSEELQKKKRNSLSLSLSPALSGFFGLQSQRLLCLFSAQFFFLRQSVCHQSYWRELLRFHSTKKKRLLILSGVALSFPLQFPSTSLIPLCLLDGRNGVWPRETRMDYRINANATFVKQLFLALISKWKSEQFEPQ